MNGIRTTWGRIASKRSDPMRVAVAVIVAVGLFRPMLGTYQIKFCAFDGVGIAIAVTAIESRFGWYEPQAYHHLVCLHLSPFWRISNRNKNHGAKRKCFQLVMTTLVEEQFR